MPGELDNLTRKITTLKSRWRPRNDKMKEWYDLLRMEDKLATKDMESFVSNDPRTAYNLALHLLNPPNVPYRVPVDPLRLSEIPGASEVEQAVSYWWRCINRFNRRRGRASWLRELVGYLLATGWYAVLVLVLPAEGNRKEDEVVAEVWNPFDVYPDFDEEIGLTFAVHSYKVSKAGYLRRVRDLGWKQPTSMPEVLSVDDCWYFDEDSGAATNAVVVGDRDFAKPPTVATEFDKLSQLPVLTGPAGGLPDRGSIVVDETWRRHVGEALVATNEQILNSYNKQMSFLLQLLRDTAQASSFEKTTGPDIIGPGKEMDLYKRGGHFRMGLQDDLGFLVKPPIPTETRTMLFDTQQMLQRGALPWIMFGNIQMQVNAYLVSQVTAAAQQSLSPYRDSTQSCQSDVSNLWLRLCWQEGLAPWGKKAPKLPLGVEIEADLRLQVPGDLVHRATVARMLNPSFRLPQVHVYDLLFPEVQDPTDAQQKLANEDSLQHPVARQLDMIGAFQEHAQVLAANGDHESAQRFEAAAAMLSQELAQGAEGQRRPEQLAAGRLGRTSMPRQEVMPREPLEAEALGPQGAAMPGQGMSPGTPM